MCRDFLFLPEIEHGRKKGTNQVPRVSVFNENPVLLLYEPLVGRESISYQNRLVGITLKTNGSPIENWQVWIRGRKSRITWISIGTPWRHFSWRLPMSACFYFALFCHPFSFGCCSPQNSVEPHMDFVSEHISDDPTDFLWFFQFSFLFLTSISLSPAVWFRLSFRLCSSRPTGSSRPKSQAKDGKNWSVSVSIINRWPIRRHSHRQRKSTLKWINRISR